MKRLWTMLIVLMNTIGLFAQDLPVKISGSLSALAKKDLTLSLLGKEVARQKLDENGNFTFISKAIKPAIYTTNLGYSFYIEPGMDVIVARNLSGFELKGKGANENTLINDLLNMREKMLGVKQMTLDRSAGSFEPQEFLGILQDYKSAVLEKLEKAEVSATLKSLLKESMEYDLIHFKSQYKAMYGVNWAKRDSGMKAYTEARKNAKPGDPAAKQAAIDLGKVFRESIEKTIPLEYSPEFSNNVKLDIENDRLFGFSSSYRKLLELRLFDFKAADLLIDPSLRQKSEAQRTMFAIATHINNSVIKEYFLYSEAMSGISGASQDSVYQNYLQLAKDTAYIHLVDQKVGVLSKMKPGNVSPAFKFKDSNGKLFDSESLKGSYVYIDFWATWCAPCRAEIPAMKEVQKQFKKQNIKFVSISTDRDADEQKWITMVEQDELPGIQVRAQKPADILKFYEVNTIPRFVLLDTEGKIIDPNAKRPSNPALVEQLNKLLSKK